MDSSETDDGTQATHSQAENTTASTSTVKTSKANIKQGNSASVSQPSIAVRTIIPNPTKCLIEEEEVKEYDETLIASVSLFSHARRISILITWSRRLHKLSQYVNAKASVYTLAKLLPTATWGQYKPVNDRSKVLCDPATGDPITIWIVGRIGKMWFTKHGIPENQASLTIVPLSKTLAQQSALLLAKFSNPMLSK